MSNYLSNIIGRHIGSEIVLAPRVRGVFEPRWATLGRPNIPAPLLGNEEGTANNESNFQFRSNEPPILNESPNTPQQVASNKAAKKDSPVFSTRQNLREQTRRGPIVQNGDEQHASLHKAIASTRSMQLTQQRVLDRVRFEVPRDEKSVGGFSSDVPNHQAGQVIKPFLKTKAPFWQEATPGLQEGEGRVPTYSSKVNPKADGSFSQLLTTQNNLVGGLPPIAQPTIKIHIGKIEIKAVKDAPVKQAKLQMPERRLSLDEFLKKRDNKL